MFSLFNDVVFWVNMLTFKLITVVIKLQRETGICLKWELGVIAEWINAGILTNALKQVCSVITGCIRARNRFKSPME